ncbi:MAG: DUF3048 domain-containing protein [Bacilli bacterium]
MKKKKLKPFVKVAIVLIILIGVLFTLYKVDAINKIKDYFTHEEKIKKPIVKPKLKIFDEDSKTRVVGVSINNHHAAWPHSGLQEAYLGYELLAEGGITRLLAFYKDNLPEKIGSVRSARHYFIDYMLENDAIFAHFGHSPQALADIQSLGINNINGIYDSLAFYRDRSLLKSRDFEHTAFTSGTRIKEAIEKYKYRNTSDKKMLLNYSIKPLDLSNVEGVIKADKVFLKYSNYQSTSYDYDKENKVYLMSMSGKVHADAQSGKQYSTKNIIVYDLLYTPIDNKGRANLNNIGNGTGMFISEGKAVPILWQKTSREAQTIYKYKDGNEVKVNDGNTWIHILPKGKVPIIEAIEEETSSTTS